LLIHFNIIYKKSVYNLKNNDISIVKLFTKGS
jgi:hypothetical protein